jgi:hypothetical protein
MKKILSILLLLIVVFIAWLCLTKQTSQQSLIAEPTNAIVKSPQPPPETNLTEPASNTISVVAVQQPTNTIESTVPLANALTATNLEQWKAAIKGLKPLAGFTVEQHWLVEQPGRTNGIPIVLSIGDKTVQYSAVLISVNAQNENGQVRRVEMQSSNMNIDETRELGLQLCDMLGVDPKDFIAWCNKVGNHWLDAPLYSTGSASGAFGIHMTYNNEKPWYINFVISHPN